MKKCIVCGCDISDRGNRSIRCFTCEKNHRNTKAKERIRALYTKFYSSNQLD